eukprot:TRINITY_DN74206_c0_g1_i1.p1 TRINITY_DN74206_c0_g1~~TRINITY_DN74206_c0_g1_i1.p1  ORF type:complete len:175 (+),score=46.09 TRINITY_DN74206_c0_g1_i1:126-650(+)
MFTVTPVSESPESRARRVSFSPDVDDNYRMNVIDKIKGLMDEVETIHRREERHLQKSLEAEKWAFKQKQEKELQDFLKRQKMEANSFESYQTEAKNNLREKHQNETLRLFGAPSSSQGGWTNQNGWQGGAANNAQGPTNNGSAVNGGSEGGGGGANNNPDPNQRTSIIDYWNQH